MKTFFGSGCAAMAGCTRLWWYTYSSSSELCMRPSVMRSDPKGLVLTTSTVWNLLFPRWSTFSTCGRRRRRGRGRGPRRRRGRGVRRGVMRGGDGEVSGKAREGTLVGTHRGNSPARAIAPGERARREPPPRDGSAGRRKKRRARERSTRAPGRRWRGHPRGSRGTSCRCRTRSRRCLPCWPWWRVSDVCVTRARGWPKRGLELGRGGPRISARPRRLERTREEHPRVSNAFPRTKTGFWGGRGNASPSRIWLARALGR